MAKKSTGSKVLLIVLVILGLLVWRGVSSYNHLIVLDEGVNEQFSQIETVLQRRADLVPNLVNTVKGYASHEEETLTAVIEARNAVQSAQGPEELAAADAELTTSLSRLMVVVEQYPDLKADSLFINLQDELAGSENRIAVERKNYNSMVKEYNGEVRRFPLVIFARLMGFDQKPYFEASPGSETAPQVNFD